MIRQKIRQRIEYLRKKHAKALEENIEKDIIDYGIRLDECVKLLKWL